MNSRELIAAFDVVADAPDGVKRLRELVLQLAVRGKLVEQDPGDEPASMLLARIAEAKRGPPAQREARAERTALAQAYPDVDLPASWSFAPLGAVLAEVRNGSSASPNEQGVGVRVLRISAATASLIGAVNLSDVKHIALSKEELAPYLIRRGDLLACRFNGNLHYVGRAALVTQEPEFPTAYPDKLIRLRPVFTSPEYLRCALSSLVVRQQIESMAATTAGNIGINGNQLRSWLVPIPPLAEQHRIVARVDELMGLLDRLEAARTARDDVRRAARDAALAALRDAEDTDGVEAAWGRIAGNMDALFAEPEDVGPLRQAVLGLAVRGRLVAQDPADGNAETLLAGCEKERKLRDRRSAPVPPLSAFELPTLPHSWKWTRLAALLVDVVAGWSPSAQGRPKEGDEWGVLKVSACSWGRFLPEENKALSPDTVPRVELEVRHGDLLISRANTVALVARSVVVESPPPRLMLSDKTLRLVPVSLVNVRYLNLANLSDVARAHYTANASGTSDSMRNVAQVAIRDAPVPLPPLAEQHRIVAKVDALMSICDDLEARLTAARDLQAQFAAAAVHHLDV